VSTPAWPRFLHWPQRHVLRSPLSLVLGDLREDGAGTVVEVRVWPTPILTGFVVVAALVLGFLLISAQAGVSPAVAVIALLVSTVVVGLAALAGWLALCSADAEQCLALLRVTLDAPIQR
jgi:hypothetical protein